MAALALGAGAGARAQTSLVSHLSETQSSFSLQVDSGVVHYPDTWTAIDDSAPGGANEAGVTAGGLASAGGYTFGVRAGDSAAAEAGPVTPSSEVTGTPKAAALMPPTEPALVSNVGQSSNSFFGIRSRRAAQGFVIGSNAAGYRLTGIGVDLTRVPSGAQTVDLYSSTGSNTPNARLFSFTGPGSYEVGVNTFTAPAGTVLASGTRYFVFLRGNNGTRPATTTSNAEDSGASPGWSIDDGSFLGGGANGSSLRVRVEGRLNRAPAFAEGGDAAREVAENTAAGEAIGAPVGATDEDGDDLAYSLEGTDAASFAIDAGSGQLRTKAALDYETKSSYSLTVKVVDDGGSDTIALTVSVTDVAAPSAPAAPGVEQLAVSWTAVRVTTTKAEAPAQVTDVSVTEGVGQLAVSWSQVTGASGYKVQWKSGSDAYNTGDRQHVVTGGSTVTYTIPSLTAGTEYTVRVTATKDNADDGTPSSEVTGTPKAAAPGQVTGVTVTAGVEQLAVSWTAVNGADGYKVQWKSGSDAYNTGDRQHVVTGGSTVIYTIPSLTAGTEYTVRVTATKADAADGPPSAEATGTPKAAAADQVTGVTVTEEVGQLAVSWTAVSGASGYKVQWKSGSDAYDTDTRQHEITGGSTTSYTIPSLTAGTEYTLRVTATKANADDGPPSSEVTGTPKAEAPGQVTGVTVIEGVGELAVSWTEVSGASGYKVQWKSGSDAYDTDTRQHVVTGGSTVTYTIPSLTAGTEYTVRVTATKANADDGPPSSEVTGTPKAVAAVPVVTLSLDPASISENAGVSTVTATVSPASATAFTVTVSARAVSPAVVGDFTLSANRTLSFTANQAASTGTVTVTAVNNAVDAPNKRVTVSGQVSVGANVTAPSDVTLAIRDDDGVAGCRIRTFDEIEAYVAGGAGVEGLGVVRGGRYVVEGPGVFRGGIAFAVSLSGCLADDLTVVWETRDGTATGTPAGCGPGADYEPVSRREFTIPAGDTIWNAGQVDLCLDLEEEPTETFTVALVELRSGGRTRRETFDSAEVGVENDNTCLDPRWSHLCGPPAQQQAAAQQQAVAPGIAGMAVTPAPANGESYGEGETVVVTVRFDAPVTVDTMGGTPSIGLVLGGAPRRASYESGSGTASLRFAYAVTAEDGDPGEVHVAASSLALNGGTIRGESGADAGRGYELVTVADARAEEGVDATIGFRVTLSPASAEPVMVAYATADGTATAGEDYTAASGRLTFAPGETEQTILVAVLDDAKDEGEERFTLRLSDVSGAVLGDAEAVGTIANHDPLPKAWLARFGRTVAGHVVDAVGERLRGSPGSHVTVGGRRLDMSASAEAPEVVLPHWPDPMRNEWNRADGSRSVTARELLLGSSFHVASEGAGGGRWAVWGRVAGTGFDGKDGALSLDGDVTTALAGVDGEWDRWLAGVAVSHSAGDGSYTQTTAEARDTGGTRGKLESTLTSVHPYVRYELNERVDVWGLLGYGQGDLKLTEDGRSPIETGLDMRMGALGVRGTLTSASETGGIDLAVRSDVLWMRMESDAVEASAGHGRLEGSEADASRLRLVLEGSRAFEIGSSGGTLRPTLELGLRHDAGDAGDAETGTGLEVGAGLRYADPLRGLTIEGAVRGLVAHEASGYEEWGASGSIRWNPDASGRGLNLTLTPSWGAASSRVERLWSRRDPLGPAANDQAGPGGRMDAELGYGVGVPGGRGVVTPYAGLGLSDGGGRTWRVGGRLRAGPSFALGLEGTRRESPGAVEPEQALMLRASIRW